jgi:outer membrane protein assembly factor BamB
MENHTCYKYSSKRCRPTISNLSPPLKLIHEWNMKDVGYLPIFYNGKVYISFMSGEIIAFDEISAKPIWNFKLADSYYPVPPNYGSLLIDGDCLLVNWVNELILLESQNGKRISTIEVKGEIDIWTQAIIEEGIILSFIEGDRYFCGLAEKPRTDCEQLKIIWKTETNFSTVVITISNGVACLCKEPGILSGHEIDSGKQLWTFNLKEIGRYKRYDESEYDGSIASDVIAFHDFFVIPVKSDHLIAIDCKTGLQRWNCFLDNTNPTNLTLDPDGWLHILAYPNYIIVSAESGKIRSTTNIEHFLKQDSISIFNAMEVTDSHLFCSDRYGKLFAMNKKDIQISWIYKCKSHIPLGNYPVIINNRLYHLDVKGNLYVFEESKQH